MLEKIANIWDSVSHETIKQLFMILRRLPRLKDCEGCADLRFIVGAIHAGKCDFDRLDQCEEIDMVESSDPPHVESLLKEWHEVVGLFLVDDLKNITLDYLKGYYFVGLLVLVRTNLYWFIGKISKIQSVAGIPFLFVEYIGFDFLASDWIPAASANVSCFYNGKGERIEQAVFFTREQVSVMKDKEFVDSFSRTEGRWNARMCSTNDRDCAALGTFTL